ncbi:MAG: tRNA preQ1(34) S-adenosylmethionine ribosyltransferase-isomerase QueA [Myxococcales bacterium]|nr:tRNA preQ1(34) S-adenosylmethionine ribosyltransferase-isomerase QueA [Myxococcales bacterium]
MRDDLGAELDPWSFELPDAQIARDPVTDRDGSRLYALVGSDGCAAEPSGIPTGTFRDVLGLLREGDLLVLNDVNVMKARLRCFRATGGAVEVLLSGPEHAVDDGPDRSGARDGDWRAFVRPGRRLVEGERLTCGSGTVRLLRRHADGTWAVRPEPNVDALAASAGEVPLPPYLNRAAIPADEQRYQTVYARQGELRASAAPTAGLHFTAGLIEEILALKVQIFRVALEVGAGTFQPLDASVWESGRLHEERYVVPQVTYDAVTAARGERRRVVAVGTTTLRVLESMRSPGAGRTDLFIRPGYTFRHVDALITNFHLPRSSLLVLVSTFGGQERVMSAYKEAIEQGFRFYSFGDAMWVEAHREPAAGSMRPAGWCER